MNSFLKNTLIFLAFICSLNLILKHELKLLLILISLGSLLSFITRNMLIIVGAAFLYVYLDKYAEKEKVKEGIGAVTMATAVAASAVTGGVVYGIVKSEKPRRKVAGKIKKAVTFIPRMGIKIKEKAFPDIIPNAKEMRDTIKKQHQYFLKETIKNSMNI